MIKSSIRLLMHCFKGSSTHSPLLGAHLDSGYEFPVEVKINVGDEGGQSPIDDDLVKN